METIFAPTFLIPFFLLGIITWLLRHKSTSFFQQPPHHQFIAHPISFATLCGAITLFLFFHLALPLVALSTLSLQSSPYFPFNLLWACQILLITSLWIWLGRDKPTIDIGWRELRVFLLCIPLIFWVNLLLKSVYLLITGRLPETQLPVEMMLSLVNSPWLFFIGSGLITILVPISEELIFRKVLLGYLASQLSPKLALFISSAIFTLIHTHTQLGASNLVILPPIFIVSYYLGQSYLTTHRISTSICIHSLFNGLSLMMILIEHYLGIEF